MHWYVFRLYIPLRRRRVAPFYFYDIMNSRRLVHARRGSFLSINIIAHRPGLFLRSPARTGLAPSLLHSPMPRPLPLPHILIPSLRGAHAPPLCADLASTPALFGCLMPDPCGHAFPLPALPAYASYIC